MLHSALGSKEGHEEPSLGGSLTEKGRESQERERSRSGSSGPDLGCPRAFMRLAAHNHCTHKSVHLYPH